jgi:PhnB protein
MPRYLQIVTSAAAPSGPPDPAHIAAMQKSIGEAVAAGTMLSTGGIGKRATGGARVIRKGGDYTVEDPPKDGSGGGGWMAGGGWAMTRYDTKADAIKYAKETLAMMGDGMMELIEIKEFYPGDADPQMPKGVVPYLGFNGAAEAIDFYKKAFGAKEIARMHGQDGKRIMHCQLEINGGALMLADWFEEYGMAPVQRSESDMMQLIVADGDAWWERAIKAGCKAKMPFEVAPWGDKYGQMIDPFGVTWAINSPAKK